MKTLEIIFWVMLFIAPISGIITILYTLSKRKYVSRWYYILLIIINGYVITILNSKWSIPKIIVIYYMTIIFILIFLFLRSIYNKRPWKKIFKPKKPHT